MFCNGVTRLDSLAWLRKKLHNFNDLDKIIFSCLMYSREFNVPNIFLIPYCSWKKTRTSWTSVLVDITRTLKSNHFYHTCLWTLGYYFCLWTPLRTFSWTNKVSDHKTNFQFSIQGLRNTLRKSSIILGLLSQNYFRAEENLIH